MATATYRARVIEELRLIADSAALAAFAEKFPFLDAIDECLLQWDSYYTEDLLRLPAFRSEFTAKEMTKIEAVARVIRAAEPSEWDSLHDQAAEVLGLLFSEHGKSSPE